MIAAGRYRALSCLDGSADRRRATGSNPAPSKPLSQSSSSRTRRNWKRSFKTLKAYTCNWRTSSLLGRRKRRSETNMRLVSVIAVPGGRVGWQRGPRLSGRLELSQRCAERIKARRVGKPVVFDGRRTVAVTAASPSSVRLIVLHGPGYSRLFLSGQRATPRGAIAVGPPAARGVGRHPLTAGPHTPRLGSGLPTEVSTVPRIRRSGAIVNFGERRRHSRLICACIDLGQSAAAGLPGCPGRRGCGLLKDDIVCEALYVLKVKTAGLKRKLGQSRSWRMLR